MNQEIVGHFIAELRKEKNLSQAELGAVIGVTNKTVSRWECGNYLPDIDLMISLCQEFDITMNELLSGKRLGETEFRQEAEDNIISSLTREHSRRHNGLMGFLEGGGTGILLSTTNMPASTGRIVSIIVSIVMIVSGWFLREHYEKGLIAQAQERAPHEAN